MSMLSRSLTTRRIGHADEEGTPEYLARAPLRAGAQISPRCATCRRVRGSKAATVSQPCWKGPKSCSPLYPITAGRLPLTQSIQSVSASHRAYLGSYGLLGTRDAEGFARGMFCHACATPPELSHLAIMTRTL